MVENVLNRVRLLVGLKTMIYRVIMLVFLLSSITWLFQWYDYFFDFSFIDALGLIISGLVGHLLQRYFIDFKWTPFLFLALVVLVLSSFYIIDQLHQFTDYSWVFLNFLIIVIFTFSYTFLVRDNFNWLPLLGLIVWVLPIEKFPEQHNYRDKVLTKVDTRSSSLHKVRWRGDDWHHHNKRIEYSTLDGHMIYEAQILPAIHLVENPRILIIGGENGKSINEIKKFDFKSIDQIPIDPQILSPTSVSKIIADNPFRYLSSDNSEYDLIIIDFRPRPDIIVNQYFTREFLQLCKNRLSEIGMLIVPGGDPYLKADYYYTIEQTLMDLSPKSVIPYHTHVPTVGQLGWFIMINNGYLGNALDSLKNIIVKVETIWFNNEAMQMMLSFGNKDYFLKSTPTMNTMESPILP